MENCCKHQNLVPSGLGGAPSIHQGSVGRGFGSISEGGGGYSLAIKRFYPRVGSKIRLWDDAWCGDSSPKEAFPSFDNSLNCLFYLLK